MNASERVYKVLRGEIPDRVPVIPKIWVDLAARLTGTDLVEVIQDPLVALRIMIEAAIDVGADGARQYHFPERKVVVEGDFVYEIDQTGKKIGKIDMQGGLMTHLFDADTYKVEDPYTMAHYHYWAASEPVIKNIQDIKKICVPDKKFYHEIGWGERQKKMLQLAGDKLAVIGDCDSATLAFYESLRGMNNVMFDLIDEPALVHAAMDKGVAIAVEKGKFSIDMGIKILRLNDSMANMSVISPQHFREYIKPHMKTVCDELHHYDPEVKIYCHICGNILPILEDLVETGLDCIAPLDPLGGFSSKQVRERVGNDIALMGGVNTMSFIYSSPQEIDQEAKICIEDAGQYGGYILGSGCVVPRSAKKEMLLAVTEAAKKYGVYKEGRLIKRI